MVGFPQRTRVRKPIADSRHAEDIVENVMIQRKVLGGPQVSPSDGNDLTDSADFPRRFTS